jgi:hypothetical protein
VSPEQIADAWWRYTMRCDTAHKTEAPVPSWETDPDAWAEQIWQSEVLNHREHAVREVLGLLAERAPAGADLGYLGAGPIEDFVTDEHRLKWIEAEAARSSNFRAALANVYSRSNLSEEQNARLKRAAGAD